MTKETLKQTLEALENLVDKFSDVSAYEDEEHAFTDELIFIPDIKKAIKAIVAAKQALALPVQERNFCPRCGKRTADLTTIHTCTPPHDNALQRGLSKLKEAVAGSQAFYGFPHGPVSTPNAGGKCVTAGETAPKEST